VARRDSRKSGASRTGGPRKHHHVYVIELDAGVWDASARFRRANPDRDPGKACLYVGMTGLTPEERYANHVAGIRSSRLVHRFARRLRPDLFEGINPMTYREAARMEQVLAKVLRSDGYGVWQN
jgi:hypothetical protein